MVERGRCPAHARGSRQSRGYGNRWAGARNSSSPLPVVRMRPDGRPPVLSQCHDERRTTLADVVDHVARIAAIGRSFGMSGNWQSLCGPCHARKSALGL